MQSLATRPPTVQAEPSELETAVDAILEQAIAELQELRDELCAHPVADTIPDILQCFYGFAEQIQTRMKEREGSPLEADADDVHGVATGHDVRCLDLVVLIRNLTDECFQMMRHLHETGDQGWDPEFVSRLTAYRDGLAGIGSGKRR